jgi:hypothetical protein
MVKTFEEFVNEVYNTDVPRNVELFEKALDEKGMSIVDVFNRLKEYGLDSDFEDCLSEFGIIKGEDGTYKSDKEFHAADFGQRTSGELRLDSRIGDIQKYLFLLNNKGFEWNPDYKNKKEDIVKIPDFIVGNTKVKLQTCYNTISGGKIKYTYRDGGFKYFLNEGTIMVVYYIKENKVSVIGRSNCTKKGEEGNNDAQISFENIKSRTGKFIDIISVKEESLIDYDMFKDGDNPEIAEMVKDVARMNSQLPPADDYKTDKYYRSTGIEGEYGINLNKSQKTWTIENKRKCRDEWDRLTAKMKKYVDKGIYTSVKAREERRKQYLKFAEEQGLEKAHLWIPSFSQGDTL